MPTEQPGTAGMPLGLQAFDEVGVVNSHRHGRRLPSQSETLASLCFILSRSFRGVQPISTGLSSFSHWRNLGGTPWTEGKGVGAIIHALRRLRACHPFTKIELLISPADFEPMATKKGAGDGALNTDSTLNQRD